MNYFSLFQIEERFGLSLEQLEKHYLELQKLFHPDRFVNKPAPERVIAMQKTADVNAGYETLKSPVKRAEHLLRLRGFEPSGGEGKSVGKENLELLQEVLEWRENLEEAKTEAQLKTLHIKAEKDYKGCLERVERLFSTEKYEETLSEVVRLRYIEKLLEEMRLKQKKF